jgi:hypothetical protein
VRIGVDVDRGGASPEQIGKGGAVGSAGVHYGQTVRGGGDGGGGGARPASAGAPEFNVPNPDPEANLHLNPWLALSSLPGRDPPLSFTQPCCDVL